MALIEFFPNISSDTFHYIIMPLLIFLARVLDVSINTMRIMMVMAGKRNIAPFLGFFEAFIWLLAIGQIIQNIDSWISYVAYAGGFATGTYVGMRIEERIAMGNVILRVITREPALELIEKMKTLGIRFTSIDGEGSRGPVNVIFMVIKRGELSERVKKIREFYPNAFYSVESVRQVSDPILDSELQPGLFARYLNWNRR
jgi:uncharacterized protein YebE (UPF0316 family)